MNDSNWTLRFPRSAREAYGHQIKFDQHEHNRSAWLLIVFTLGLLLGALL